MREGSAERGNAREGFPEQKWGKAMRKRMAALLAAVLLAAGTVPAAGETLVETIAEDTAVPAAAAETEAAGDGAVTEKDGFHFSEKGFLVGENPGEEYIFEDEENGVWQYASKDLAISITRTREKYEKNKKRTREYCIAEIRASENAPFSTIATQPTKKNGAGIKQVSPELLVENHPCVFAVSDDMYGIRYTRNYNVKGIVIRDGEVISEKTRNSAKSRPWPNLDTMAIFPDGSMKSHVCDELTAEEYLAQGAVNVLSFGPWLISDGEMNPKLKDPKYYPYNEPRAAIGMIEPYHYVIVAVRGRPTEKYAGVHLDWLAERLLEKGCTEALNLDGGETVVMMFNGKVILQGGARLRSVGSLITFGLK